MSCGRGDGNTSNITSSTSSNGAVAQLDVGLCSPSDLRGELLDGSLADRLDRNTTLHLAILKYGQ